MTGLQWHPAFFASMKVFFAGEKVELESEHNISTKPMQIDVLAKKEDSVVLGQNIGRIFRRYNVMEYKSPEDYLSIDDYYKVYGYACFYKSESTKQDEISILDITITFVCHGYPRELIRHLNEVRGFTLEEQDPGIYYIKGEGMPVQLVVTSRLSEEKNFWLKYLTNRLKDKETANRIAAEYQKHQNDELYKSMMNVIVNANKELFEEVRAMCEALRELWKDDIEKVLAIELPKKEAEVTERVTREVTREVTEKARLDAMKKIMKNLSYTAEQTMKLLEIPPREQEKYRLQLQ